MTTVKKSIRKLNTAIILTCIIGCVVSHYAHYVEIAMEMDNLQAPVCDITKYISCTKTFSSTYTKGFGLIPQTSIFYVPNSIYGIVFYIIFAILSKSNQYGISAFVVALGICANFGAAYLAYILYKLNNICLVCVILYFINAIILLLAVKKHKKLHRNNGTNKKKKLK